MACSRVAIIGAGAAGLAAARALCVAGIAHVEVFERRRDVAGLWRGARDGEAHCVVYDSLRTNLPKECMGFTELAFEAPGTATDRDANGTNDGSDGGGARDVSFVHRSHVRRYLEQYARAFGLASLCRFGTAVEVARKQDPPGDKHGAGAASSGGGRWVLDTRDVATGARGRAGPFDALVVANGHYAAPAAPRPPPPGLDAFVAGGGRVMHSSAYRPSSRFRGALSAHGAESGAQTRFLRVGHRPGSSVAHSL